jgi:hypothetical protein
MVDESPVSRPSGRAPVSAPPVSAPPVSAPPVSVPSGSMAVAAPAEVKLGRLLMESKAPPRALAVFIVSIAALALWLGSGSVSASCSSRDAMAS